MSTKQEPKDLGSFMGALAARYVDACLADCIEVVRAVYPRDGFTKKSDVAGVRATESSLHVAGRLAEKHLRHAKTTPEFAETTGKDRFVALSHYMAQLYVGQDLTMEEIAAKAGEVAAAHGMSLDEFMHLSDDEDANQVEFDSAVSDIITRFGSLLDKRKEGLGARASSRLLQLYTDAEAPAEAAVKAQAAKEAKDSEG